MDGSSSSRLLSLLPPAVPEATELQLPGAAWPKTGQAAGRGALADRCPRSRPDVGPVARMQGPRRNERPPEVVQRDWLLFRRMEVSPTEFSVCRRSEVPASSWTLETCVVTGCARTFYGVTADPGLRSMKRQ